MLVGGHDYAWVILAMSSAQFLNALLSPPAYSSGSSHWKPMEQGSSFREARARRKETADTRV